MLTHLLSRTMTRRQAILATAGASLLTLGPGARLVASAQGAGDLVTLSYPKLSLTVTDTAIDGVPATTAAGRYLITLAGMTSPNPPVYLNGTTASAPGGKVGFVSPPAGMPVQALLGVLAGQGRPPASPVASPVASPAASPALTAGQADVAQGAPPAFIYQSRFAGGAFARPGTTGEAVIDLQPGDWIAWGDDPTAGQKPVAFTVTGDFQPDVKDPQADITATLVDFAITIEGNLTAGTHILKVVSHGAEPHFLEVDKGPDTMTKELVGAALRRQMNGTPEPGGFANATLEPAFYTPVQSIGTTTWHAIDLKPGSYLAACFFPTAGTGVPHAMNGMFDVFKVTS
jgi:hypothetical protein